MLPARRSDPARALALDGVLERLTGGAAGREAPDNPDGWVTAVRRQPAAPAHPAGLSRRMRYDARQIIA